MGVIDPAEGRAGSTVVVACAEDFGGIGEAERAFEAFGRALGFEVRSAGRTRIGDTPVERFRLKLDGLLGAVAHGLFTAVGAWGEQAVEHRERAVHAR